MVTLVPAHRTCLAACRSINPNHPATNSAYRNAKLEKSSHYSAAGEEIAATRQSFLACSRNSFISLERMQSKRRLFELIPDTSALLLVKSSHAVLGLVGS